MEGREGLTVIPGARTPFSLLPRPRRLSLPPSRPPFVPRRPAHPSRIEPYQVVPFWHSENYVPVACDPVQQQTIHCADGHFSQSLLGRDGVGRGGAVGSDGMELYPWPRCLAVGQVGLETSVKGCV
ncbi:hypothetical protein Pmani_016247 [Petrolisthes manimaculis]|uniref:Uncharacterized protein n=1 Tax=Petrolisthes manimaculis TaxID=1843537 RepID=A0AAE1U6L0_9EUCA|nr:hypothetical protein Pmani_016247 [Petrolisthes manimaculis]